MDEIENGQEKFIPWSASLGGGNIKTHKSSLKHGNF